MFVGGTFTTAGNKVLPHIARVTNSQTDADADGVCDSIDNCPGVANGVPQVDSDSDQVGDACDRCPNGDDRQDTDGDGVPNICDNCHNSFNPGTFSYVGGWGQWQQPDSDGDQIGNGCDNCPANTNTNQVDADWPGQHYLAVLN